MSTPRVAIVCDWLTNMGGAEKLVLELHRTYPEAPIFTSVFDAKACPEFAKLDVRTTWLQKLPAGLRRRHQLFAIFRTWAFRRLDLSSYDIIISSASAEAKAVRKRQGAVHICYCHTPTRYYWSHYNEYLKQPGLGWLNPIARLLLPVFVPWLRRLDLKAVAGVDHFIANSSAVAERIKQYYDRESTVIYPPVDMARFLALDINGPRKGFVIVGRQVDYKRFDLAIDACNQLSIPLKIISEGGPAHKHLAEMAGPTISFLTGQNDQQVAQHLAGSEAFIAPQLEDFGITTAEAQAAGTPVIAFGQGGSVDIVVDGKTGVFFSEQTTDSLKAAIARFQTLKFTPKILQLHAQQFSDQRFRREIAEFVSRF